jgi:hypothetical protein
MLIQFESNPKVSDAFLKHICMCAYLVFLIGCSDIKTSNYNKLNSNNVDLNLQELNKNRDSEIFSKMLFAYENLDIYKAKASYREVTYLQPTIKNAVDLTPIRGIRGVTLIEETLYQFDFNNSYFTKIEWIKCNNVTKKSIEKPKELSDRKMGELDEFLSLAKVPASCVESPYSNSISENPEKNRGTVIFENNNATISTTNKTNRENPVVENLSLIRGYSRVRKLSGIDSLLIPLLDRSAGTSLIDNSTEISDLTSENLNGTDCFVLTGDKLKTNQEFGIYFTLWVGKNDFLIRKVKMVNSVEGAEIITQELHEIEEVKWRNK